MEHIIAVLNVSECRACKVLGQPRSSQRRRPTSIGKDQLLIERIKEISIQHPRYGYRRVWAGLRREGWGVNRKRVQRLWQQAQLQVVAKQIRRRRLGTGENGCAAKLAQYPNHVWSYDF